MKGAAIVTLAVATFLGHTSVAAELTRDDATRPIIAQMLNDPGAYANKTVTIYGLVIQKKSNSVFILQDVSQQPLKVVGTHGVKASRWRSNHYTRRPLKESQWSVFHGAFADADARSWRRRLLLNGDGNRQFFVVVHAGDRIGAAAVSICCDHTRPQANGRPKPGRRFSLHIASYVLTFGKHPEGSLLGG